MTMLSTQVNVSGTSTSPQVFLLEVSHQNIKNNNYLVVDPDTLQAVIVDPAWEQDKIDAALARTRATLSGILITHTHFDHIHLARSMADLHNCPIWMSREEIAFSQFEAPQLVAIDEMPWFVGNMCIEPILTPGHTPGCVCYKIGDNLFTGDVLFAEGCGICRDLSLAHAMFDSLGRLKDRIAAEVRVFPGHTYVRPPGQKFGDLLAYNIYLNFPDRDSFAAFRLRQGQSLSKLLNFR